jgi:hypothetical protein
MHVGIVVYDHHAPYAAYIGDYFISRGGFIQEYEVIVRGTRHSGHSCISDVRLVRCGNCISITIQLVKKFASV